MTLPLAPHSIVGGPLVVSNHSLGQIAKCSTQALLGYVLRLHSPDKSAPAAVGVAFHKGAEALFKGRPVEEALSIFKQAHPQTALEAAGEPIAFEKRLLLESTSIIFEQWALAHRPEILPYTILQEWVEGWFRVPLDEEGQFIIRGRLDYAVYQDHQHLIVPGDVKTTGKIAPWTFEEYRLSSQVDCYIHGMRELTGDPRIVSMIVNIVELGRLPDPGKKCRVHGVDYGECRAQHAKWEPFFAHRTELQLQEWKRSALFLSRRLKDLRDNYSSPEAIPYVRQQGRFNGACKFCDFSDFCAADRPKDWIGSRLTVRHDPELETMEP